MRLREMIGQFKSLVVRVREVGERLRKARLEMLGIETDPISPAENRVRGWFAGIADEVEEIQSWVELLNDFLNELTDDAPTKETTATGKR